MLLSHLDWLKNCHAFMLSHIKLAPTANIMEKVMLFTCQFTWDLNLV